MTYYAQNHYTELTPLQRLWLRILLGHYKRYAANETRLIAWMRNQIANGDAMPDEIYEYTANRIRVWTRIREIKARLGITK